MGMVVHTVQAGITTTIKMVIIPAGTRTDTADADDRFCKKTDPCEEVTFWPAVCLRGFAGSD
jgi:hypothetical protein